MSACQTDLCQYLIDDFFCILFRPDGSSELVVHLRIGTVDIHHTDVDDIPVADRLFSCRQFTGFISGSGHAAILGYYVARPDGQQRFADGAGKEQGLFKPVPFVVHDVRITAFFVRIVVIHQQHVRTNLVHFHTTRRLSPAHGHERHAGTEGEVIFRPFVTDQISIEEFQAFVRLELSPVLVQQFYGTLIGGGSHDDAPLILLYDDQIENNEHNDGALCQFTRPAQHFIPVAVRMSDDPVDGFLLEFGELILGIPVEYEFHPLNGICLQLAQFPCLFFTGHGEVHCGLCTYLPYGFLPVIGQNLGIPG